MKNEDLTFYPEHPSGTKTHKIETSALPLLSQNAPFDVKTLYTEYQNDLDSSRAIYEDKRFEVTGVALKVGPDVHNKPAIEISDRADGRCYALCVFPADDFYDAVSVGNIVTVRANFLVMTNQFGVVMKYSELVGVKKP